MEPVPSLHLVFPNYALCFGSNFALDVSPTSKGDNLVPLIRLYQLILLIFSIPPQLSANTDRLQFKQSTISEVTERLISLHKIGTWNSYPSHSQEKASVHIDFMHRLVFTATKATPPILFHGSAFKFAMKRASSTTYQMALRSISYWSLTRIVSKKVGLIKTGLTSTETLVFYG